MCGSCVKDDFPDRDNTCLDSGSYMVNFAGCSECQNRDAVKIINHQSKEDEMGIELVTYEHVCGNCNHTIAQHEYTFKVEEEFQVYQMECLLCGSASDERSILPVDPRGPQLM